MPGARSIHKVVFSSAVCEFDHMVENFFKNCYYKVYYVVKLSLMFLYFSESEREDRQRSKEFDPLQKEENKESSVEKG